MKRLIICSFCFVLAFATSFAQTGTIRGNVLDENGAPIEFANVLLFQASDSILVKGTLTDSLGNYAFEEMKYGGYMISTTFVGYTPAYSQPFELQAKDFSVPQLSFGAANVQLSEVVVKSTKPFMELQSNKLVINVESSPASAGNTALELLAKSPGVTVDQNKNISLRGKQGVLILIDDKNPYLSSQEISRMLETMPAENIERIEIITNPSAKYDAAGNAGIINIVLKKNKNYGLNGNLNLGAGYGRFPKANSGIQLNYRQNKVNVFGNYNYYYNKRYSELDLMRRIPYEGELTIYDQKGRDESFSTSHRFRGGVDYFVSDKTTIGILVDGRTGRWEEDSDNNTFINGLNPNTFSRVSAVNNINQNWDNYTYNLNFKHDFDDKGRSLTFDADYSSYKTSADNDYANYFLNTTGQEVLTPNLLQSNNGSDVSIKAVKADYSHPLKDNSNLEVGVKASSVETDNSILFLQFQDNTWVLDPTRTNQFLYTEDIYAGYVNYGKQFKKFNIQAGLRGEYTISDGHSITLEQRVKRDSFNLFPSLSLSHNLGEKHSLSYSYSRRIDRPSYQNLNPFTYFLDQFTFERGNPFLQPQYTNAFSTTYGFNQQVFVTASYSRTNNAMTEVLDQDSENQITFQTSVNLAQFDNYSLNVSSPITISKWWTTRVNLAGFYNDFQSPYKEGSVIDNQQLSFNGYMSNEIKLPGDFQLEISGWYQSPVTWGMFEIHDQYSIDGGLSKKLWNGKGNLKLSVNDIFNILDNTVYVRQGDIDVDVRNKWETRRVNLSFSYKFGNQEVKAARQRSSATEDELNRVKQN